jgi:ubiquinone biosynthesis protein COQ9
MPRDDKLRLLQAALEEVPFSGYSERTLKAAARKTGLPSAHARLHFPRGAESLVEAYSEFCDQKMKDQMSDASVARVRDRVAMAVRLRLEAMAPQREAARRAAAFLSLPQNVPLGAKLMFATVDAMWRAAGDQSSDFNYYTKRGLLAGVYSATLVYWLNDSSEGHAQTWAFLDARIEDIMKIQKMRGRLEKALQEFPNPIEVLAEFRNPHRS